jgi:hypothetical protein
MVVWVMDNGAVQKVKSSLRTKNHKHRYINVSNTLMGASISRKNDLFDTPFFYAYTIELVIALPF